MRCYVDEQGRVVQEMGNDEGELKICRYLSADGSAMISDTCNLKEGAAPGTLRRTSVKQG